VKKNIIILGLIFICIFYSCLGRKASRQALYDLQNAPGENDHLDSIITLQNHTQEDGNPDSGYQYLLHGDMFSSGVPYSLYKFFFETPNRKALSIAGYNKYVLNDFAVFKKEQVLAAPGCFHCHAQVFDGKLVIGLGNSYSKFQVSHLGYIKTADRFVKLLYGKNSREWKNAKNISTAGKLLAPRLILQMQGPNPAHRIADIMASHRDPQTLRLRTDTNYFSAPVVNLPTDIPALWLAKKKNAWNYNGMMQGSPAKNLMIATILTLTDSSEAAHIYEMMKDAWAYLQTLEAPKYPYPIDIPLAKQGEYIFTTTCSGCHGTYGANAFYPNKVIPVSIIGTDSLMLKYYRQNKGYEEWYNTSWYATTYEPGFLRPQYGYMAPPLDGIWMTAPYFHNGSVPTVEAVLNSKIRPRYWKRSFKREEYDFVKLGWKHRTLTHEGTAKSYNTDIPGYGNYGHYFGDGLSDRQRIAVIEYLKTL
jgi:hypothetical protein